MIKISYNDGGALLTFFGVIGIGFTQVKTNEETSITLTIKVWKLHTFLSFALI